ncbi:hypothetical protein CROQUDRAFT_693470 [Cronartium quercuum f. sp. fusiforme G11]|uniref:Reverse transcriptase zinc-binding domain-containing protein n=1 Tax=Cronartium quercuum f. sp. fusiforme G11 TaxID=708437 RepID=A0A9P6TF92_9BASI|nr:hypothetical protein CROQUDRAFT_693470 [Cronartium quercuum f. sp. fusiforme G11]
MGLGGLLRHTKEIFQKGEVAPISPFKMVNKKIIDALDELEKGQASVIFQLRSGHCPLRKYLHRIGAEPDPRCEVCKVKETPTHFLAYCRRYTEQRRALRKELKKEKIWVDINSATGILDNPRTFGFVAKYVESTGRFIHLKSYSR